jgi:hypothetical protein
LDVSVVFVDVADKAEVGGEQGDGVAEMSDSTSLKIGGDFSGAESSGPGEDALVTVVDVGSRNQPTVGLIRTVLASRDIAEGVSPLGSMPPVGFGTALGLAAAELLVVDEEGAL